MFVGHSFLAIALTGILSLAIGIDREKALVLAVFAGLFAAMPDIDIIYAFKEIAGILSPGSQEIFESFWAASTVTHRNLTHSLVTAVLGTSLFTLHYRYRNIFTAVASVSILTGFGFFFGGALISTLVALFGLTGLLLTELASTYFDFSAREFLMAPTLGLLSHPFGDVFTGVPPNFFEPLGVVFLTERLQIFQGPVLNFLAVFTLELAIIWAGLLTIFYLNQRSITDSVRLSSLIGLAFGPAAFFIRPSISNASVYVFSVLLISITAVTLQVGLDIWKDNHENYNFETVALNFVVSMTASLAAFSFVLLLF